MARQAWLNAAEARAVHDERFGVGRQDAPEASWSERLADAAVATAQAEVDGPVLVEAELCL